jgi:hypothetical protein
VKVKTLPLITLMALIFTDKSEEKIKHSLLQPAVLIRVQLG